jgi:RHS repeat-associated protein
LSTTHYINGFQYFDNVLQFFPTPEGYVKNTPTESGGYSFDYVYNYTDHLGNIRLSYTQDPQTGALAILEENHYYPFGLQHKNYNSDLTKIDRKEENNEKGLKEAAPPSVPLQNPGYMYKFGGKELQTEFDINWYDVSARNYDPALGRWMNIDPLAELMRRHSPYNFAFNNPLRFIDPDGMAPEDILDDVNNAMRDFLEEESKRQKSQSIIDVAQSFINSDSEEDVLNISFSNASSAGGGGCPPDCPDSTNFFSNLLTVSSLVSNWMLGLGKDDILFEENRIADAMRNAWRVNEAREYFYNKYNGVDDLSNASVTNFSGAFGIKGLFKAGIDPVEQFIGSYRVDINAIEGGNYLQFTLTNTTSFKSLMYGIGPDWERDSFSPMSNVSQSLIFIEPVKR